MAGDFLRGVVSLGMVSVVMAASVGQSGETFRAVEGRIAIGGPHDSMLAVVPELGPTTVEVWDVDAISKRHILDVSSAANVQCLTLSSDGTTVFMGSESGEVLAWDVATGKKTASFRCSNIKGKVSHVLVAPNAEHVAATFTPDNAVTVWERRTEKCLTSSPGGDQPPLALAFTKDGGTLTAVFPHQVWQWRAGEAELHKSISLEKDGPVHRAVASPGGSLFAWVTGRGVVVLRASDLSLSQPLEHDTEVRLAFTPDDSQLLCTKDFGARYQVDIWDASSAPSDLRLSRTVAEVAGDALALSPDSAIVALPIQDGTVVQLASLTGGPDRTLGKPGQFGQIPIAPSHLAFSPDGKSLVVATGRTVQAWNVETGAVIGELNSAGFIERLWLPGDGKNLVMLDEEDRIDIRPLFTSLQSIWHRTLQFVTSSGFSAGFGLLDVTPDGRLVAVALKTGEVVLIDAMHGKELGKLDFFPALMGFSKDGRRLLLMTAYSSVLYDVQTGAMSAVKERQLIASPAGPTRFVHGRYDDKLALWDTNSGLIAQLFKPQAVEMTGQASVSWDGKMFAFLSDRRGGRGLAVEVFELSTGRSIAFAPLNLDTWYAAAFSPDNQHILVGSRDSVEVVDYRTRQTVRRLARGGAGLYGMAISSSGRLATIDATGEIDLWDYASGRLVDRLLNPGQDIHLLRISEDGSQLVYAEGKTVHMLDVSVMVKK